MCEEYVLQYKVNLSKHIASRQPQTILLQCILDDARIILESNSGGCHGNNIILFIPALLLPTYECH